MICTVCKYTPIELFAGFGEECNFLEEMPASLDRAEAASHANLCGFGKALIEEALSGQVEQMVLVNCCDVMRRCHDVVAAEAACDRLFLMDLPHTCGPCQVTSLARSLKQLRDEYREATGIEFDLKTCQAAFETREADPGTYVAILGARAGKQLEDAVRNAFGLAVRNLTCTGTRSLSMPGQALLTDDEDEFFEAYAQALLAQVPCMRMDDSVGRRALLEDPNLAGIVYHTMKFCDFYSVEYAEVASRAHVPVCKIESDFTAQSTEQLRTRVEAFAEALGFSDGLSGFAPSTSKETFGMTRETEAQGRYFAGIDSGSTSTDVVIVDGDGTIISTLIVPTGAGASKSSEACLASALEQAGLTREDLARVVTTGYGRAYIGEGDASVTEITCHAAGARHLDATVRTIIDIGGQDSKVISLDADGHVAKFVMNDKCAAGTGRFLEMMARALQISLDEMSETGLAWREDIAISSTCSVFAESEVVSLVAQNKDVDDIVHGLCESVAAKTSTLVKRAGGTGPYMMTGGVAANAGVVAAIERRLGQKLIVSDKAQLCGALGAALLARGNPS